ncbi:MAG: DUF4919 domain-containing protein [Kaistella sp.]|nr:DUF4919 domain-containing protein [Kaistella sp.]
MKQTLLILCLFPILVFSQENFNYKRDFEEILKETKDKRSDIFYEDLLERYNKVDTTLSDKQLLALLIGFTDNRNYKPYKDFEIGRKLYKLNDDEKYAEVIKLGNEFLKTHPFDIKSLFEVAYAYHKSNQQHLAEDYLIKGNMIFKAMYYSGNAKSIETPAFALNPSDGQDFITKAIGAKIGTMGSGSDDNGYFIDMLEAKFEDDSMMMLYFIIPHATKKMFE